MRLRMTEQIAHWAKVAAVFVFFWGSLFAWRSYGCRKVVGGEMEPAIKREAMKVADLRPIRTQDLRRGEIVLYDVERPGQPWALLAGRVLGLPGDRVRIANGEVFVNDARIDQSYVMAGSLTPETLAEIVVPRDTVYVLGDNRQECRDGDSRGVGPVGVWAIEGRIGL